MTDPAMERWGVGDTIAFSTTERTEVGDLPKLLRETLALDDYPWRRITSLPSVEFVMRAYAGQMPNALGGAGPAIWPITVWQETGSSEFPPRVFTQKFGRISSPNKPVNVYHVFSEVFQCHFWYQTPDDPEPEASKVRVMFAQAVAEASHDAESSGIRVRTTMPERDATRRMLIDLRLLERMIHEAKFNKPIVRDVIALYLTLNENLIQRCLEIVFLEKTPEERKKLLEEQAELDYSVTVSQDIDSHSYYLDKARKYLIMPYRTALPGAFHGAFDDDRDHLHVLIRVLQYAVHWIPADEEITLLLSPVEQYLAQRFAERVA